LILINPIELFLMTLSISSLPAGLFIQPINKIDIK